MGKFNYPNGAMLLLCAASAAVVPSCADLYSGTDAGGGVLVIEVDREIPTPLTKTIAVPDPDDFMLTVTDSRGNNLYSGAYGESPEQIIVSPGTYTVSASSCEFDSPVFDCPQYGDTQVVSVVSGQTASVLLRCSQRNSGLMIEADPAFRSEFPHADLYLKAAGGTLIWSYGETRTAFFKPGAVSVVLDDGGDSRTLWARTLAESQIVYLKLSASYGATGGQPGIRLVVDTLRTRVTEEYVVGGSNPGGSPEKAYTVMEARDHVGEKGVWVQGYMVGVATGTGHVGFDAPFTRNTNVVLGLRSNTRDAGFCLSAELSKGDIRDALNLQDNPGLQNGKVILCGDVCEAYYGIPGIKNVTDYRLP